MSAPLIAGFTAAFAVAVNIQQAPHVRLTPGLAFGVGVSSLVLAGGIRQATRAAITSLSPKQLKVFFLVMAAAAVACMICMGLMDEQVRTSETPLGIISFELAFTAERMKAIRAAWSPTQLLWVAFMQGTDHLFMVLYSTALALGCLHVGKGADLSYDVAALQLMAGIADFLEGLFLHAVLVAPNMDTLDERIPLGAGACAAIKFFFLLIGFAYIIVVLIAQMLLPTGKAKTG